MGLYVIVMYYINWASASVRSVAGSSEAQTSVAGRILAAYIDLEEGLADADLVP